jgi:triphosphoribosyl-dephospho-CoA synthase
MVQRSVQSAASVSQLVIEVTTGAPGSDSAASQLADAAVWALIQEAELTPKPALVDSRGSGPHDDMDLRLLICSANTLHGTFRAMAEQAFGGLHSTNLGNRLAALGRKGEQEMLRVTSGVNTHRGAIWTLGLLCSSAAMINASERSAIMICTQAAKIARSLCETTPQTSSHGSMARLRYGVRGARGEAEDGFPHLLRAALPMLRRSRAEGLMETHARLNALLALVARLDDTCLLHRGGVTALDTAKTGARKVLSCGGVSSLEGMRALCDLDRDLNTLRCSPGGSADLLAATLFVDRMEEQAFS